MMAADAIAGRPQVEDYTVEPLMSSVRNDRPELVRPLATA